MCGIFLHFICLGFRRLLRPGCCCPSVTVTGRLDSGDNCDTDRDSDSGCFDSLPVKFDMRVTAVQVTVIVMMILLRHHRHGTVIVTVTVVLSRSLAVTVTVTQARQLSRLGRSDTNCPAVRISPHWQAASVPVSSGLASRPGPDPLRRGLTVTRTPIK